MAEIYPNVLLVEGKQDVRVIPELMENNGINWGTKKNPIVYIRDYDGYDNLIKPDVISTELQASGLSALGIMIDADYNPMIDADNNPSGRWQSIRNACLNSIPDLPKALSIEGEGLIYTAPSGVKFGIWVMPDNQMCGMLETFLTYIIPDEKQSLWEFAQEVTREAKNKKAPFKNAHLDKANIYTWLAWQNEPGRQLHEAIKERILNPNHPNAQQFVSWFKNLYNL